MLRPARMYTVARPRRKPQNSDRKRINLSFNMGVHSEAAAYETLKKLSQSRKATEFITSLIMQYLVDDAKVIPGESKGSKNSDAVQPQTVTTPSLPNQLQKKQAVISPQNEPSGDAILHSEKHGDTSDTSMQTLAPSNDSSQEAEVSPGVSMKGIEDAMAIFGF